MCVHTFQDEKRFQEMTMWMLFSVPLSAPSFTLVLLSFAVLTSTLIVFCSHPLLPFHHFSFVSLELASLALLLFASLSLSLSLFP